MVSVSGLASGIDTDTLIEQLLQIERRPITLMRNKIDDYQLKLDAFRDINTRLTNLQNTLDDLRTGTSFGAMSATSSNTSFLTASASSSASAGTYNITINTLAQAHTVISETTNDVLSFTATITGNDVNINPPGAAFDATTLLSDLNGGAGVDTTAVTLTVGNTTTTVDLSSATTAGDVKTAIEAAANVTVTLFDGGVGNKRFIITANSADTSVKVTEDSDTNTLGLGGTTGMSDGVFKIKTAADSSFFEVFLNGDLSFTGFRDAINNVSGRTFTASVVDNRLRIASNTTGTANALQFQDNAGVNGLLEQLNILEEGSPLDNDISDDYATIGTAEGGELKAAQDASFTVDGQPVTRSINTGITDVINGVTLNLLQADGGATNITLTVSADTSAAVADIKAFIDQYNSTVSFIQDLVDYNATTEKAGTLQGDFTANNILNQLSAAVSKIYDNAALTVKSLFHIVGDSNQPAFEAGDPLSDQAGQIILDETALSEALVRDPQAIEDLFSFDSDGDSIEDSGLARDLDSLLDGMVGLNGVVDNQETLYEDLIDGLNDDILRFEDILVQREETLRAQFTSMETAIGQLNNISAFVAAQLTGLSA